VRGISFDVPREQHRGAGGRVGVGQERHRDVDPEPAAGQRRAQGSILWQGRDLLGMPLHELQHLRGKEIACVFQDPMTSLNPVFTVGEQLCEPLVKHLKPVAQGGDSSAPSRPCWKWACPSRSGACRPIRTSCPVASSSA
jgi:ABC-type microcin C transport system duplicated ATPase subunit YejF